MKRLDYDYPDILIYKNQKYLRKSMYCKKALNLHNHSKRLKLAQTNNITLLHFYSLYNSKYFGLVHN